MSIRGVGSVVAATVLGEAGDFRRFENWKQLRKLSGYNLVEQSSGQNKGQSMISKRGRPALRHVLYLAAVVAIAKNRDFQALYASLTMRQRNPLKGKQALLVVATRILRGSCSRW
ncbi:MAG: transposase [Bacillota bacterium]